MSAEEKQQIDYRLAEVARSFGLKVKLTVNNAHKIIEENYLKIREIDKRIQARISSMRLVA